jgi:hypothetical protein
MKNIEIIKNRLIDRVLATNNEKLLKAIESIFDSTNEEERVMYSSEQIEMLQMSDMDIENGNIVSEEELNKFDAEWQD